MANIVLPMISLPVIVYLHFVLMSWACFSEPFMQFGYLLCNLTTWVAGIWALHDFKRPLSAGMYTWMLLFSVLNDVVCLATYSTDERLWQVEDDSTRHHEEFSFAIAIIFLLLKPFMCLYAYLEFRRRGGAISFSVTVTVDEGGNPEDYKAVEDKEGPPAAGSTYQGSYQNSNAGDDAAPASV